MATFVVCRKSTIRSRQQRAIYYFVYGSLMPMCILIEILKKKKSHIQSHVFAILLSMIMWLSSVHLQFYATQAFVHVS